MKKLLIIPILLLFTLGITSVHAQWTTTGTDVGLTTTTNNVVVGPAPVSPATSTTLYLNNTTYGPQPWLNPTILTINNSAAGSQIPTSQKSELDFNVSGVNAYKLYYSVFPNCGSSMFHIIPASTGPGIHMSSTQISFSNSAQGAGCGNSFGVGKYVFDGMIGSSAGINVGYNGQTNNPPSGYSFSNRGASYFYDKVLIGTTSTTLPTSSYKLYVGGSVICEELVVKLQANWPDFVFAPAYKLKPLCEVKSYIAENSHLPGVPAAAEIEANGVATGEMLTIQMKKIEELTLYMIQMQEENEALKKRIEALEVNK